MEATTAPRIVSAESAFKFWKAPCQLASALAFRFPVTGTDWFEKLRNDDLIACKERPASCTWKWERGVESTCSTVPFAVSRPLRVTNTIGSFNVLATVSGGGVSGQAGAISHATARALLKVDENYRQILRQDGLLTRDPRAKERKKYGLKRARKAPQYTKR